MTTTAAPSTRQAPPQHTQSIPPFHTTNPARRLACSPHPPRQRRRNTSTTTISPDLAPSGARSAAQECHTPRESAVMLQPMPYTTRIINDAVHAFRHSPVHSLCPRFHLLSPVAPTPFSCRTSSSRYAVQHDAPHHQRGFRRRPTTPSSTPEDIPGPPYMLVTRPPSIPVHHVTRNALVPPPTAPFTLTHPHHQPHAQRR